MAIHRYVVTVEFKAWIPGERDDPEKQLLSIKATDDLISSETPKSLEISLCLAWTPMNTK